MIEVTGEYYVIVPEWIISEFGWYEGTELNMEVDETAILISEVDRHYKLLYDTEANIINRMSKVHC